MSRPPLEVADLIRSSGTSFIERNQHWLSWKHIKVLRAIRRCRTAALGGHIDQCTRDAPLSCRLAFSCSAQNSNRKLNKKNSRPMTRALFGSAPPVVGQWWFSKDLLLPRSTSVLHRSWSRLPHETTVHNTKTLRASPRSVPLRLAAEPISSFRFSPPLASDRFALLPALGREVSSSALRRIALAHLDTVPSHY
jgi:Transposase zinc-binding domain